MTKVRTTLELITGQKQRSALAAFNPQTVIRKPLLYGKSSKMSLQ